MRTSRPRGPLAEVLGVETDTRAEPGEIKRGKGEHHKDDEEGENARDAQSPESERLRREILTTHDVEQPAGHTADRQRCRDGQRSGYG